MSATYGTGAGLFRVNGGELNEIWVSNEVMSNHYSTSVYHDGHLYGFHGRQEYSPSLRAVELRTGTVNWDIPSYGAGTVTRAGDQRGVSSGPGVAGSIYGARHCSSPAFGCSCLSCVGKWADLYSKREHTDLS